MSRWENQEPAAEPTTRAPRAPSLLDAVLPVVVLIILLATTIILFGIDATNGPLQVGRGSAAG
jgi:NhaC family Na+:H+ antiporter